MDKAKVSLNPNRVVLGMSGGIDSSVSLMLLKEAGYQVVAVSLIYDSWKCSKRPNACCSDKSLALAANIAKSFKVDHVLYDVKKLFNQEVIEYFSNELKNNRTPSPCIFCNPKVKFYSLMKYADEVEAKYIATGHYARIDKKRIFSRNQFVLKKAVDKKKDQSYSLSFLTQKQLSRVIFPLGKLTKDQTYEIAQKNQVFFEYKKIKQSQDFCFLGKNELIEFVKQQIKPVAGKIYDVKGNPIGKHDGLANYTLGQRKGIKLPGGPYFVIGKKLPDQLIVSKNKSDAFSKETILKPYNLTLKVNGECFDVMVKTRSSEGLKKAKLVIEKNQLRLKFTKPVTVLTPGQVAVFYRGDVCLGGGVIN